MDDKIKAAMAEATRLTQAGRFAEATALIQRVLGARPHDEDALRKPPVAEPDIIEGDFERVDDAEASELGGVRHGAGPLGPSGPPGVRPSPGISRGSFRDAAGARDYRLYMPRQLADPAALLVMLHGCGQNPDTFADLTRMDALAEQWGFAVLYPAQSPVANASGCWCWYDPDNQVRGAGEPGILAGMTGRIRDGCRLDARQVYVAGFSAGGTMAATLAATYPELFAGVGVHSGLPYGIAGDMVSALTLMAQGPGGGEVSPPDQRLPPIIVFHGDGDATVSPANSEALIRQFLPGASVGLDRVRLDGRSDQGVGYSRIQYKRLDGALLAEHWLAQGLGHGWLGGRASAPFAEPRGPDASREMLGFFWSLSGRSVPEGAV
ncbi:PHB depolymerase family esterase [Thiorhodococcus minor]|uniref:PHB depolymerase family esterase n=1 Tax=Thiorhodococcus minor TaxID=57489 RepID=A0A6M0K396_9GAMM|nr:PHB depolymerase family esterase [Thiorhodococcus minor]